MSNSGQVISSGKLNEILQSVAAGEKLDSSIEAYLNRMAEECLARWSAASAELARHRRSSTLEPVDVNLHLERHWDISLPGYINPEDKQAQRQGRRRTTQTNDSK